MNTGQVKNQRTKGYIPFNNRLRIDSLKPDAQNITCRLKKFLPLSLVAAFFQLPPLPRHACQDQSAPVQHPQKLLQLVERDFFAEGTRPSNRSLISSRLVSPSSISNIAYSSS